MDPTQQTLNLFITHVDKEGPFLKVWGQTEKNNSIYVEQFLLGASPQFELGIGKVPFETLHVGMLVCAKYKDNKYYRYLGRVIYSNRDVDVDVLIQFAACLFHLLRHASHIYAQISRLTYICALSNKGSAQWGDPLARIVSIDYLDNCFVELNFLDYGHRDSVPHESIRSLHNFPTSFISLPPLATGFILAEAHCPGGDWTHQIFDVVSNELRYRQVHCQLLIQATQYYLIKLYIDSTDILSSFISRGLMQPIAMHAQQAVLLSMRMQKKLMAPPQINQTTPPPPPAEITMYKACTLEPMQQYAVYVSFVNEGPTYFSVQLQQSEQILAKLMKEINEINLKVLDDVPLPGTICLARCQEDLNICRAVVTNEVDNLFKVFFVDFGNYETLPLECLYQIPFKYVLPKVMAIRLALNGIEKSSVTLEMLLAFKKFVDNRLLYMKVLPSQKKTLITKCELWDPETKTSALDVINRAAQHAYPEPLLLNRGFTQQIKVSYVFSCNRFYVQLCCKELELFKLMAELQISCQSSEPIFDIKIGLPCCALFEADQQWYRSEIVDVIDKENVKVRYIDYGNEEAVPIGHLRMVEGELLTVLRPQAIECCLNGYQNLSADDTWDVFLEELIFEKTFTMKVSEMAGKKALVELIDANNYNVASLLLEKIAASKSQVSPMLVHAGHTLEHRKSSDSSDTSRNPRKPARDWPRNDNENDKGSWRSDAKDTRETANNNTSPDGGSWRQNNKGFNRNDRPQREEKPNDINDRFNRNRENKNDNWSNKENDFQKSGPATAATASSDDGWGENASSPAPGSSEMRKPRDDKFSGGARNRFEDKGDRGGWNNRDRENRGGDKANWNNRDRGERSDKGGWNKDKEDRGWNNRDREERDDKGGWNRDKEDRGWNNRDREERGDKGGWNRDMEDRGWNNRDRGERGDKGGWNRDKEDRGWNNKDREERGDKGSWKKDGFKKDFGKDGSEMSSSGSEKSFRKGPRTSSRNDHGAGGKQFHNNKFTDSFNNKSAEDSWSVSDVTTPLDAAPATATFAQLDVIGSEAAVVLSWFHNPAHFFCQLQSGQPEFKILMEDIQQFYKNRQPETCVVGAPVVGLFPEDNVLYRAKVLESLGAQRYKVFYVDFGNVETISKIWPIEKKYMDMPAQAICCGLSGISPNGENWPDPATLATYFNREYFMARFLTKDENRTFIELWDNQEEVAQLLCQANLAVGVAPQGGSSDIEVPLLLNQQFRVILKSVNNLNDIIVALEGGLALTCKAHNLEMASESYEDVLQGYLEQTLIVYVDNILENDLLDVTFYDNDGNKIAILTPDEGALDNVEPLCPCLVLSSTIYGYVSHASDTSVFIQASEYSDQIATLLEQMFNAYEAQVEEVVNLIPEEGFVYAVHSEDGNWYRGRVASFDDDKATVSYVDYGNSESVAFSALRDLKPEFNVPNIMCLQVTILEGSTSIFLGKDVVASIYYGESGWEGTVQECAQPTEMESKVDLQKEDTVVAEAETTEPLSEELNQPAANIVLRGTPVFVSHIDSPTQFYVQFTESLTALTALQEQLQTTVQDMPIFDNITVGVLCAAPFSVDHQWYRAEVLDADEDITTVRFVDYGNTDVINNQTTEIKTLPPDLLSLAVYATRCSLKLKAVDDEWNQQALELFEGLANKENVTAEFIIQDEKTNIVELFVDGENIKDLLLAQNLAVPCEIVTESKSTCFVSHLNSPSEFWVHMENCVNELEWIAQQLSGAEGFPELEDMAPGTLCAALFPDDEMWYRARILSNTIAGIELLFIDYGNSCVSSSLRQLPEDLLVTPPLAQKCCLQRPEGIPYWTKQAQSKFAEISAEGQTIFTMKKISTGETATVELLLNGENIVSRILPVTEDGYVKSFETLNKFNIERNEELLSESVCLEAMPGMEWDEPSSTKFRELFPEDTLFQVELIGEDCVRLYYNGTDIRTQLGGIRSSLNVSNVRDDKTDNSLGISEEDVIDYMAGGDNLENKHSVGSELAAPLVCDKDMEEERVKVASEESETDSGNHSEHEPKNTTCEEAAKEAELNIESIETQDLPEENSPSIVNELDVPSSAEEKLQLSRPSSVNSIHSENDTSNVPSSTEDEVQLTRPSSVNSIHSEKDTLNVPSSTKDILQLSRSSSANSIHNENDTLNVPSSTEEKLKLSRPSSVNSNRSEKDTLNVASTEEKPQESRPSSANSIHSEKDTLNVPSSTEEKLQLSRPSSVNSNRSEKGTLNVASTEEIPQESRPSSANSIHSEKDTFNVPSSIEEKLQLSRPSSVNSNRSENGTLNVASTEEKPQESRPSSANSIHSEKDTFNAPSSTEEKLKRSRPSSVNSNRSEKGTLNVASTEEKPQESRPSSANSIYSENDTLNIPCSTEEKRQLSRPSSVNSNHSEKGTLNVASTEEKPQESRPSSANSIHSEKDTLNVPSSTEEKIQLSRPSSVNSNRSEKSTLNLVSTEEKPQESRPSSANSIHSEKDTLNVPSSTEEKLQLSRPSSANSIHSEKDTSNVPSSTEEKLEESRPSSVNSIHSEKDTSNVLSSTEDKLQESRPSSANGIHSEKDRSNLPSSTEEKLLQSRPSSANTILSEKDTSNVPSSAEEKLQQSRPLSVNSIPSEEDVASTKPQNRPSSANNIHDELSREEIVPTSNQDKNPARSRPSSALSHSDEGSRPSSAQSHRLSHDDRILPAVLSRPQSPLPAEPEN